MTGSSLAEGQAHRDRVAFGVGFVLAGAGRDGDRGYGGCGGVLAVGHGRQDERRQGDEEEGEEPDRRVTESGVRIIWSCSLSLVK